jgi:malate dehydrogenase
MEMYLEKIKLILFSFLRNQYFIFIQNVILHLLDITPMLGVLQGVVMEIEDTSLPLVKGKILCE